MVYGIDNQITTLQSATYSTNQQLIQKRDDLERLKTTFKQVENYQEEFQINQRYCFEPELTVHTWNGQQASQFQDFRHQDLQESYQSIVQRQFEHIISQLADKMEEIRVSIGDLQREYVAKNTRLSDLRAANRGAE
ncbi:YwqH-like family protein [Lentibacillus songyuanensis]|uniref:YwqH-like family protein n=1 Tax=Lentibacillus songyuanensis TaxID=3136161 RepID=UPI0031BB57B0